MELYTYAGLTDEQLKKVQAYEARVGKKVLVLKKAELDATDLSAEDLAALKEMEAALGMVALVVS